LPAICSAILATVVLILGVVLLRYEVRRKTAALSKAKEEAESNQRLYRATLDNTSQLQGLLSPDGTVLNINQTSLTIIGANKESVVGCLFWETASGNMTRKSERALKMLSLDVLKANPLIMKQHIRILMAIFFTLTFVCTQLWMMRA